MRCHIGEGVIRLPKWKLHKMDIPEVVKRSSFCGSSKGWIALQEHACVRLFHPFSGALLRLPPLTTIPGVGAIRGGDGVINGLIFSHSPEHVERKILTFKERPAPFLTRITVVPSTSGGVRGILALSNYMLGLVFARPEGEAWTFVDMPSPVVDDIDDITSYRGSLYAVDSYGRVAAWDRSNAGTTTPKFTRVVTSSRPPHNRRTQYSQTPLRYLVEAKGELLQVVRDFICTSVEHGAEGLRLFRTRTTKASIFRLKESSGKGEVGGCTVPARFLPLPWCYRRSGHLL